MNNSIRDYLINIYDKLSRKATLLNGIALFKYLIKKEFYVNEKCNYIIKELTEQTHKLNGEDKKECLILLPYFFIHQTSLKYLTKILHILFSQINHTTEQIFVPMSKIFADILINVQSIENQKQNPYTNIDINNKIEDNNKYVNILLRLCLDLINNNNLECIFKSKNHDFNLENYQQKCGFLFLGQFIENYNDIINDNEILSIIINLLRNHFHLLKNKNYAAKKEYLLCINILINKLKKDFSIYSKELLNNIFTFDKILTYSSFSHKNKNNEYNDMKKNLLEIIYSLLLYNKEELIDNYKKLLIYGKINKSNPNKEIRAISIKIIDIIIKDNYLKDLKININNYTSNDLNKHYFSKTKMNNKERAFSFKNRESMIKKLISEDKKKYADKKQNKNFIFVSQKSMYDSEEIKDKNYFTQKKENKKYGKKYNKYSDYENKEKDINYNDYENNEKDINDNDNDYDNKEKDIKFNNYENKENKENKEKDIKFNDYEYNEKEINGNDYENKGKDINCNNLNVVNLKIHEIQNMNDTMIKTVNNIENYLNNNFNTMEIKLNRIDNFQENYKNNKRYGKKDYYGGDNKKNILDEKINNIILNDEKLVDFIRGMSEKELNKISIQYYEQILNRLMILYLINKNNTLNNKLYSGLIQKLLDSKKIYNKNEFNKMQKSNKNNYQKYKISYNLENNLHYLFNCLNN